MMLSQLPEQLQAQREQAERDSEHIMPAQLAVLFAKT